jgi:hypothetical protein
MATFAHTIEIGRSPQEVLRTNSSASKALLEDGA